MSTSSETPASSPSGGLVLGLVWALPVAVVVLTALVQNWGR